MAWGGRRPGAGRKREGITKKVSLTLTAEEWKQIEDSGEKTVAALIKKMLKERKDVVAKLNQEQSANDGELTREQVGEILARETRHIKDADGA